MEASTKQLEEQVFKIKKEMLSSSTVPSASDTSSKAPKVRKRKGTMAPDVVASDTPVPPKRLLRKTQGRRVAEAGQDDT